MIRATNKTTTVYAPIQISRLLLILLLAQMPFTAIAQDGLTDVDLYPLRPADLSSPRDTLKGFLKNMNEAIADWRKRGGDSSSAGFRSYERATQTLDFSAMPDSNSALVRRERSLFLKELLDRIELPPDHEIPGDAQVTDNALTRWAIPDTQITIRRIDDGPRAGEFLFSADTVLQLDRLYRQARHLAYHPGATAGIYEEYMRSPYTVAAMEARVRNRLMPVDTSSPRSTLEGFLDSVNRTYTLAKEAEAALQATPPTMSKKEAREVETKAANLLRLATATLDLSRVPESLLEDVSIETALQLKEIFDRMVLPLEDSVPNDEMVKAAREQRDQPVRWRYPNTAIEIVEITDGEQRGQFLFSADSVARIPDYYEKVRELPYRRGDYDTVSMQSLSSAKSEGFYEAYIRTPGKLIPHAHVLARLVDSLPASMKTVYYGQTTWQWAALALSVMTLAFASLGFFSLTKRFSRRLPSPLDEWLKILSPIIIVLIVLAVMNFINHDLNITGDVLVFVKTATSVLVFAMLAWAVYVICKAVAESIIATPRITTESSEAALLRVGARVVGFLIAAWVVIYGIQGLGADLIPLLAGLGVGGLAVALAVQSTIANFFGGLILFANKPVRVGDFCRYGEDPSAEWLRIGTVEEIGLISTRIRGIDRTVTTIPNGEFSNMHIVNLTKRDHMAFRPVLGLRYETKPDQLRFVLANLRELLLAHPRVMYDPARVRFAGFGEYSLNVEILAYVNTSDWNEFLAIQEDLNLRIINIVEDAGTGFALPSRVLYHGRDGGLDRERQQVAEKQVREWASAHMLPFPDFDTDYQKQIKDTLNYPPSGSPGADRG